MLLSSILIISNRDLDAGDTTRYDYSANRVKIKDIFLNVGVKFVTYTINVIKLRN